jgi:hypothetical protein
MFRFRCRAIAIKTTGKRKLVPGYYLQLWLLWPFAFWCVAHAAFATPLLDVSCMCARRLAISVAICTLGYIRLAKTTSLIASMNIVQYVQVR